MALRCKPLFSPIPRSKSLGRQGHIRNTTSQHNFSEAPYRARDRRRYTLEFWVSNVLARVEMFSHLPFSYALYSSLSPGFQSYLENLTALHSAVAQAEGARAAGLAVRRQEIETIHPVVRVHPATGWKSVYVNPGTFIS